MLVGEPGIGKTRLAEEIEAYASDRTALVLWGRCHEAKGAPPYWPWIESLRGYLTDSDPERLERALGRGAGVIAELIPEVKDHLAELPQVVRLDDPESSRFRLFDAVATFLAHASENQPLVMILDDLHWADESTLALLEFIASDIGSTRLLIIGTYRDVELGRKHPLETVLGDLARQHAFERIVLRGLDRPAVVDLLRLTGGVKPDKRLAETVHERTEGNPFFVGEVVRLLAQAESPEAISDNAGRDWSFHIPEGIRQVIGRRLNHMSDRCNDVLTTAAVAGRAFSIDVLLRLQEEMSEDDLIDSLDEALSARILDERSDSVGQYQFTHALVQQTLIEELTLTRRVKLHARIARSLEELYGEEADDHAAELVTHFAEAETILGREKIARYSLLAGKQAEDRFARNEAKRHYQRGVEIRSGTPMDDEQAQLLVGAARAIADLVSFGNPEAYAMLRCAYKYYAHRGNLQAVIDLAQIWVQGPVVDGIAQHLSEEAILLVEPGSHDEARLLPRLIESRKIWGRPVKELIEECRRGLATALSLDDRQLEMRLRTTLCFLALETENGAEIALQEAEAALEVSRSISDPGCEAMCRWIATLALGMLGMTESAFTHYEAFIAASEKLPVFSGIRLATGVLLNELVGNWDAAADLADRLLELSDSGWELFALAHRARIHAEIGETQQAGHLVTEITEKMVAQEHVERRESFKYAPLIPVIAMIAGDTSHVDKTERHVRSLLALGVRNQVRVMDLNVALACVAVVRHDGVAAAELYGTISEYPITAGYYIEPGCCICALAALTGGMPGKAAEHFQEGIEFTRRAGYLPVLGWTGLNYAELLMESGDAIGGADGTIPGANQDPKAESPALDYATQLLDEGLAIAEKLGMKPLQDRIVERQTRLVALHAKAQVEPKAKAPAYPDGLTKREVEVLQLVAKGFTNNEIADLLHISFRTVSTHVSNTLEKTGTANRAEATAYAIHHGLVEE